MSYYVFVGQNATTGKPNRITGRMSNWGRCYQFTTQSERNNYYNEFRSNNPSEFCVKVNLKTARKYNLGMSVKDYREYMDYCIKLFWCEESNSWEWG